MDQQEQHQQEDKIMPMVGKKKFGYGTKGVAKAKSYAKKTGKKMSYKRKKK